MANIPGWFVVVMGMGTVFISLIMVILLCKILSAVTSLADSKKPIPSDALENTAPSAPVQQAPVTLAPAFVNRQEVIAAIGVAIAEEIGVDVDAIRITSIKRI
jgi:sodium pump decarboxylase gamma subunit